MKIYSPNFLSIEQIEAEEKIAEMIFNHDYGDNERPDEESCAKLGRDILKVVLESFRPDLFVCDKNEGVFIELSRKEASNLVMMITENWKNKNE